MDDLNLSSDEINDLLSSGDEDPSKNTKDTAVKTDQAKEANKMADDVDKPLDENDASGLDSLLEGGVKETNIQEAQFSSLQNVKPSEQGEGGNISLLLDVPMEVTVELGRSVKSIKEILSLGEGSIIELDKLAGEPVDLLVNGKPIAKGEVVVIDENFGVRVTEIIDPKARLATVE